MKKLLLSLVCVGIASFSTLAQKDISVTLNLPVAGTTFEPGIAHDLEFTITNVGADDLVLEDSVWYALSVNGQNVTNNLLFLVNRSTAVISQGQSWDYVSAGVTFNTIPAALAGVQDLCVEVVLYEGTSATATVEANMADNSSCLSYTFVAGSVGLNEEFGFTTTDVHVYPNPASDIVNFKLNGTDANRLEIVNLAGQVVLSSEISNAETSVNVSDLEEGVYLFTIYSNEGLILTDKLIVE